MTPQVWSLELLRTTNLKKFRVQERGGKGIIAGISNRGRSAQGVLAMRTGSSANSVVFFAKVLMKDEGGIRESEEDEDSVDSEESEDND